MEKYPEKIISTLFYPLMVPTWFFLLMFNLPFYYALVIPQKARWLTLALVFLITFIIPQLLIGIFNLGKKRAGNSSGREKYLLFLALASIFSFLAYYLFSQIQLSPIFNLFNLGATLLLILCLVIMSFWKISIYMVSAGAFFGALLSLSITLDINMTFILFGVVFISGLIGFARLSLAQHTPAQVYAGFLFGAAMMFVTYYYF